MLKIEKQVIAYTSTIHSLIHILELAYGVLLVSIGQDFGIGFFILGILSNILGFTFGLSALPFGYLADRIKEKRLLTICCFGIGISTVAIGLSPNLYVLGGALSILGLSLGIYHPTGSAYISRTVIQRGLGFGYHGIGGNIGVAFGPILAGIVASSLGWRAVYLVYAVPCFLLAALLFFTKEAEIPPDVIQEDTLKDGTSLRTFMFPLALILVISIMNGLIYRGIVTFLPAYLAENVSMNLFRLDPTLLAGSFTTVALLFGVGGQFLGGFLCERIRREQLAMLVTVIAIPLLIVIGMSSQITLIIMASGFAFFHFMGQPIFNNLIADYSPSYWRGTIYGIYFFCSFGLGSFSATILGFVADNLGINQVFIISAGFAVLASIGAMILFIRSLRNK